MIHFNPTLASNSSKHSILIMSDKTPPSAIEEQATKKKYAILYGYCGTGYQGSQTCFLILLYHFVATMELKRLMMT